MSPGGKKNEENASRKRTKEKRGEGGGGGGGRGITEMQNMYQCGKEKLAIA